MRDKITTESFIRNSNLKHNNKYDYSETIYQGCLVKLKILCRKHGIFEQKASNHLRGQGCPKCGIKRLSLDDFILKCKSRHGDTYDYSKVNYKTLNDKVVINCREHGDFLQSANSHEQGHGCPKCKNKSTSKRLSFTTDRFVKLSISKHGDKYDYSKVEYKRSNYKIKIICKKHGEFEQSANNHLRGFGCPECAFELNLKYRLSTTEEFISKSKIAQNKEYDYSLVKYKDAGSKVIIICPIHGQFEQNASHHLQGHGCKKCAVANLAEKSRTTNQEFIEKCKIKYKNLYDYSITFYEGSHKKVNIVCPLHGSFSITPTNHMSGQGCSKCGRDKLSKSNQENPTGWSWSLWEAAGLKSKNFDSFKVYIIKCWNDEEEFYKVGKTFLTVKKRFKNFKYNYELLDIFQNENSAYEISLLEKEIQNEHKKFKYIPKLKFDGMYECFSKVIL